MVVTFLALTFALFAGLVHVGIFFMESVLWRRPHIWRRFGVETQKVADDTAFLAFNQGFYNLFLALGAVTGVLWVALGTPISGWTLIGGSCASMVAAALVLRSGGKRYTRAALIQGTLPALALICAALLALSR